MLLNIFSLMRHFASFILYLICIAYEETIASLKIHIYNCNSHKTQLP